MNRVGHYEIREPLGKGGMGEVYRAFDPKLKRDFALKVLPEAFASDPERMARFQREAEVLAALNHPNIAAIYGVEDRALVMELVEGETLHGPLPLEIILNCARQIAEANLSEEPSALNAGRGSVASFGTEQEFAEKTSFLGILGGHGPFSFAVSGADLLMFSLSIAFSFI
jgi:serine/threonine protein kinase